MTFLRITRFTADPADSERVVATRAELISAVRAQFPGLGPTRLARIDDETWMDSWCWDSKAALDAVAATVPSMPVAQKAFALVKEATIQEGEIVDER